MNMRATITSAVEWTKAAYLRFFGTEPIPKPAHEVKETRTSEDEGGEFYFRETILDDLGYYMKCLTRMRRADRESFDLYSQIGGCIIPAKSLVPDLKESAVSPWFRQTLPSFGAIFTGSVARDMEKREKCIAPRFFYFTKYDRSKAPPEVQRASTGSVYIVTTFWDDPEKNTFQGTPSQFPVLIATDGTVSLLRSLVHDEITLRDKKNRLKKFRAPRHRWVKAHPFFVNWAEEHGKQVEDFLAAMFVGLTRFYEASNSSVIRVTATDGALSATFGVDIKRTPYFFKDRQATLNEAGRRRRIFHIVRPHIRGNGKAVKFHFRGERSFFWNGYAIKITVPHRDHFSVSEFNIGSIDVPADVPASRDDIDTKALGKLWRSHIVDGKPMNQLLKDPAKKSERLHS